MTRIFIAYLCIAVTLLFSCRKADNLALPAKPNEQQVTLRLLMPQQNSRTATYAIDEVSQNTIRTLDVLAFRIANDGKEYYAYHRRGVLLNPNQGATEVNFHVDLLKSTDNYRFVLIANAASQLQTALKGLGANTEKETLLGSVEYSISAKWNAANPATFTPLPMWGESGIIPGISNTTLGFSVGMIRSLAAIDVVVSATDFILTDISVYNMPSKGRVTPKPGNYSVTDQVVISPSMPAGSFSGLPIQSYVTGNKGLSNEIFLFERTAPQATGLSSATSLVVAGKYNGSSTKTYYRIDLTDGQGKPMDILRNHRYAIDITKVSGSGFGSIGEAGSSKPVDMEVTITPWNSVPVAEGNVTDNYLYVSDDRVEVSGLPGEYTFSVRTNVPNFTDPVLPNWITISSKTQVGDNITYKLQFSINTSTTQKRTAKLNVQAGRITRVINVSQGAKPLDLGPDFGFYLFARNVNAGSQYTWWYQIANVEYNLQSMLDASLTQRPVPYSNSCVAILGPGARLPTINELRQLLPVNSSEREAVDNAIWALGGQKLSVTSSGMALYLSSSSQTVLRFRGIETSGGEKSSEKYKADPTMYYLMSRCVVSK